MYALRGMLIIASRCTHVLRRIAFGRLTARRAGTITMPQTETMLHAEDDTVDEAFMDQWRDLEQRSGVTLSLAEARYVLLLEMVYSVSLSKELAALQRLRERYHPRALPASHVLFPSLPSFEEADS